MGLTTHEVKRRPAETVVRRAAATAHSRSFAAEAASSVVTPPHSLGLPPASSAGGTDARSGEEGTASAHEDGFGSKGVKLPEGVGVEWASGSLVAKCGSPGAEHEVGTTSRTSGRRAIGAANESMSCQWARGSNTA